MFTVFCCTRTVQLQTRPKIDPSIFLFTLEKDDMLISYFHISTRKVHVCNNLNCIIHVGMMKSQRETSSKKREIATDQRRAFLPDSQRCCKVMSSKLIQVFPRLLFSYLKLPTNLQGFLLSRKANRLACFTHSGPT